VVEAGKEAQVIGLASQSDRQKSDRLVEDRQTGRKQADERWYLSRPYGVLNSGLRTPRRRLKPVCDDAETLAGAGADVRRCSDALRPRKIPPSIQVGCRSHYQSLAFGQDRVGLSRLYL
jgi:hypothetical protein